VPDDADRAALAGAGLVALSICNHEMGTQLALDGVAPTALRIVDAVQAAPWLPLADLSDARTYYALSGAKLGAPLGVGALRVPSDAHYAARAAGTPLEGESPPWLAAIGMGAACAAHAGNRDEALRRARSLGDRLLEGLRAIDPALLVNGAPESRLGPIVNVSFPGLLGRSLVTALSMRGVCISHTAACQSRLVDASPVVRAAYPDANGSERAAGATRWSVSERTTESEIDRALEAMRDAWTFARRTAS
jgi:cysteine desulfurase